MQAPDRLRGSPDPPADPRASQPIDYAAAGAILFDRVLAEAQGNTARLLRDRADIEALRFDSGGVDNHWAIWNSQSERYEPRGSNPEDGGLPEWIPRPVTNLFHTTIQGLTSILDQSEPAQVFAPRTESDKDQAAADVAEDAVPVLREECGYDSQGHRHELNRLATLTSGVAYVPYYDNDEQYGMDEIPVYKCTVCGEKALPLEVEDNDGQCPNPACENTDPEAFEEVQDPRAPGKLLTVSAPIGRICADVLTSFEYTTPNAARRAHAKAMAWFLSHRRMSPLDIGRLWPWAKDVADNKANWADNTLTKAYADEMRRLSSPTSGGRPEGGGAQVNDGPVVFRLQHDPIIDDEVYLPQGYYGVRVGERRGDEGPLPFTDADEQPFKNVLFRQWEGRPASAHGHPPADDLIPIQKSRNFTQALIELILMYYASPTLFIPDTVTFLDEPTGIPGQPVRYRSVDGQKPTVASGVNPPQALFAYLEQQDQMMDRVSGLNAVLRGDRAKGDPTLGEVQILEERGMATFRAPLDSLTVFEKDLAFMLLAIARQTAWSPRFRRIRGENGQWEIKQFSSADLDGQIDIVVNRASAWPRSPLMQQLRLKEALAMGVLPPPATDPELQAKILADMNLSHLKKSLDADRKYIAMQLERWKAAVAPEEIEPPDPLIENLPLGFYLKQQFLKGEQAQQMKAENPPVYEAMRMHLSLIQMAMQPPAPPEEPTAPDTPEPGSNGELDRAIEDGTLVPDDGQPGQGGALEAALASGALVPDDGTEPTATAGAPTAPRVGPSIDQLTAAHIGRPIERPAAGGGL